MRNANCVGKDPELFFPKRGQPARTVEAKTICANCSVRTDCESFRERTGSTDGIWGGMVFRLGRTKG
jgi:WhiB family transcriptional regulator, redox-sensing transcriptional regulator